MTEAFIDTSFAVALVNTKDHHHLEAVELSFKYDGVSLITTDCILYEIGNSLARALRAQAVTIINNFLSSDEIEVVKIDETIFRLAFEMYRSHTDKTWGLVDRASFVVMRERGISKALSSDRHFNQAGFETLFTQMAK